MQQAHLSGGLACFVNPADSLPFDLAQGGKFLVYVAEADAGKVQALRLKAAGAGLLGRSMYVEHRAESKLSFGDHFADLVIAPESADEKQILRVLSPVRGRAFLGTRIISKPLAPGMGDWTHRLHAADNNPVSDDTAFHGPPLLQWLATPMQTSFQGGMLAAGGRRFELSDWVTKKPDRNAVAGAIRALAAKRSLAVGARAAEEHRAGHAAVHGGRTACLSRDERRLRRSGARRRRRARNSGASRHREIPGCA